MAGARLVWSSDHPLDLARCTARYTRWGLDPMHRLDGGWLYRVIAIDGRAAPYRAAQLPDGSVVVEADEPSIATAGLDDLRYRLGEPLNPGPIADLAARDPVIGSLWRTLPGYRPPLEPSPYEQLVGLITAQQVNLRWAVTTRTRFVAAFGTAVTWREQRLWGFPAAPVVAATDPAELRELQFTWMKARSIVAVAEASATGALDGIEYEDHAGVVDRVTPIYGIGRWSADWLAARCLALPAVVAPGDLGVRQAIGAHYLGADRPATADEVGEVAATWGNAANWAVHLLLERLASG